MGRKKKTIIPLTNDQQKMVVEYLKLANYYAHNFIKRYKHLSVPDTYATAHMALCEAVITYKYVLVKFSVFARYRIVGRLIDFTKENKYFQTEDFILESITAEEDDIDIEPFKNLIKYLPTLEQEILYAYYVDGLTKEAASKRIKKCKSYIYKLHKEALLRIKEDLDGSKEK